jgi:hypothetical protein
MNGLLLLISTFAFLPRGRLQQPRIIVILGCLGDVGYSRRGLQRFSETQEREG